MDKFLALQAMTNHNKSLGDFLDELDSIESLPQKLAKIYERLTNLNEKNKEDEDRLKKIITKRNAVIAQILVIRQKLLSPPSSSTLPPPSSSSLQPPASSNQTYPLPSSVSYPLRPPHPSNRPSLSNFSSSPSSGFQPYQSSSNRPRLSNIFPSPLSSSPSQFVNTFLPPQDPTIQNFISPRPQIFQGPRAPLPNPNRRLKQVRLKWTDDRLKGVFDEAVARLGGLSNATPKRMKELMAEQGLRLTEGQISSHLQFLRNRQRDI